MASAVEPLACHLITGVTVDLAVLGRRWLDQAHDLLRQGVIGRESESAIPGDLEVEGRIVGR